MRAMDKFDALADAAEDHGMFTDDVAGADREQRDFFFAALADYPFTTTDHDFIEIAAQGVCCRLAERQSGAAGRVFFEPMMCLDYFNIVIIAQPLRSVRHQCHQDVHSQTGVSR